MRYRTWRYLWRHRTRTTKYKKNRKKNKQLSSRYIVHDKVFWKRKMSVAAQWVSRDIAQIPLQVDAEICSDSIKISFFITIITSQLNIPFCQGFGQFQKFGKIWVGALSSQPPLRKKFCTRCEFLFVAIWAADLALPISINYRDRNVVPKLGPRTLTRGHPRGWKVVRLDYMGIIIIIIIIENIYQAPLTGAQQRPLQGLSGAVQYSVGRIHKTTVTCQK